MEKFEDCEWSMRKQIIDAWGDWIEEHIARGWKATFLTITFNQIKGPPRVVAAQMVDAVEAAYARALTQIVRHPRNVPVTELPLWICCPDYPIAKRDRDNIRDIVPNDGRHIHVIAVVPPRSRLKTSLADHLTEDQRFYAGREKRIWRIHAERIRAVGKVWRDDNAEKRVSRGAKQVGRYAKKSVASGRVSVSEIFVLPRSHAEMQQRKDAITHRLACA